MLIGAGCAFLVSWAMTAVVGWAARRWRFVDAPNERSSHVVPTPTLGGLGILAGVCVAIVAVAHTASSALLATVPALLLFAIDDLRRPLGAGIKTAIQLGCVLIWLIVSDLQQITVLGVVIEGPLFYLVSCVWIVALMNVYNFMDGIDGISGIQAVVAGAAWAILFAIAVPAQAALPVLVAAAAAGFLVFNLPPARIFMGDVGSAFLGLVFGVVTLRALAAGLPLPVVLLPLGVYLYDTSLTILRRLGRGENILRAHREHVYQRLVQQGWSHGQVTAAVGLVSAAFSGAALAWVAGRPGMALLAGVPALLTLIAATVATWNTDGAVT